jgi:hypothetical protein
MYSTNCLCVSTPPPVTIPAINFLRVFVTHSFDFCKPAPRFQPHVRELF